MKIKGEGVPNDNGFYSLPRSIVLEVLTRHYVKVSLSEDLAELYLLERDEYFNYFSLPGIIPSAMVFRLAKAFKIPAEEFYQANRDLSH